MKHNRKSRPAPNKWVVIKTWRPITCRNRVVRKRFPTGRILRLYVFDCRIAAREFSNERNRCSKSFDYSAPLQSAA